MHKQLLQTPHDFIDKKHERLNRELTQKSFNVRTTLQSIFYHAILTFCAVSISLVCSIFQKLCSAANGVSAKRMKEAEFE